MAAALVSLGIFVFCTMVGLALVFILSSGEKPYLPLLAPILGAAAITIPSLWLTNLDVPVQRFGPPLILIFLIASSLVLAFKWRRLASLKPYWPFALILLGGFLLFARPMFEFGFDWLSYSNDDMTNYVLTAERLLSYGYNTPPDPTRYAFNEDPTIVYWLWAVVNERYGAELFASLFLSATGLNGFQMFMPVMAALGLTQIAAAAALVYRTERYRMVAIVTACLMAASALATFGIEYQLIAQVAGLPLMVAALILTCDLPRKLDARSLLLCTTAVAGLTIIYPEISLFFILSVALHFGLQFYRRSLRWRVAALWLPLIAFLTMLFLNVYVRNYLAVVEGRTAQSAAKENPRFFIELFPFYLIPSGLSNLFGFYSSVQTIHEPWLSLGIFGGLVLLAALCAAAVVTAWRGDFVGAPLAVMLAVGFALFVKHEGFGLFKLAMYIQPFAIPCLVLCWFRFNKECPTEVAAS